MTVKELRDELEYQPDDAQVMISASTGGGFLLVVTDGETDLAGFEVDLIA